MHDIPFKYHMVIEREVKKARLSSTCNKGCKRQGIYFTDDQVRQGGMSRS